MQTGFIYKVALFFLLTVMPIILNSQDYASSITELNNLVKIRKELHANPEYSHLEVKTAAILLKYLKQTSPDKIHTGIGGNGIIVEFSGNKPGPSRMFRCEMDAIKTDEGCNHLCGHDGHMTILIGLAGRIARDRDFSGKVFLLFQPAEEVGEGAALMVKDIEKLGLKFDFSYALHNNPGYPLNTVIIHEGTYAAGSTGMELNFEGASSHAAFPEQAVSPMDAIFSTIGEVRRLNSDKTSFSDFILGTVVNVEVGKVNYGVTPGEGSLRLTLRSFKDTDLDLLCGKIEAFAKIIADRERLKLRISYHDRFPATVNSIEANKIVIESAVKTGLNVLYAKEPTRGSDDFSFFTINSLGSFFDIGNGHGRADIHQQDYQFQDEIIMPAIELFNTIIKH
ncbi:MAG: amidohydrolase [Clostridia bacterium]|nr:amidohydrolase [Clostridia bacterium]